jgi:hypothetical protein
LKIKEREKINIKRTHKTSLIYRKAKFVQYAAVVKKNENKKKVAKHTCVSQLWYQEKSSRDQFFEKKKRKEKNKLENHRTHLLQFSAN